MISRNIELFRDITGCRGFLMGMKKHNLHAKLWKVEEIKLEASPM